MSEYQYYEFHAIDRPLDPESKAALRAISTRAHITTTSFVNTYEWGDLKADPRDMLKRHFDLFLYLANWGSRRFALKLPRRLVDLEALDRFQIDDEVAEIKVAGAHLIIDIRREEIEDEDWDGGGGRLAALAPLRAELLAGDLRLFVLLWLIQVGEGQIPDDMPMPAPGLGPLSGPLAALADFLAIDDDLLEAATQAVAAAPSEPSADKVEAYLRTLAEEEKLSWLRRLHENADPHLGVALRRQCREALTRCGGTSKAGGLPTAGDLRAASKHIASERRRMAADRAEKERLRREREQAQARAARLIAVARRGESAWREVEQQIEQRNATGYDRASTLLADLAAIADQQGDSDGFARRLADIRGRHARKGRFIERLDALPGCGERRR